MKAPKSKVLSRAALISLEMEVHRKEADHPDRDIYKSKGVARSVQRIESHHQETKGVAKVDWGYHICESPSNLGIFCVYAEDEDQIHDCCLYCGLPEERK